MDDDDPGPPAVGESVGAIALTPGERLVDPELRLQHALDTAYGYLGRRDRTVLEVRRRLELERVDPRTIGRAVEELTRAGYLDDARYAVRFAEDRRSLDSWGAERIERRLRTVGVSADHVQAALARHGASDEREAAVAALQRRYAVPPGTPRERERALGFLMRKGYALELAYEAIRAHERDAPELPGP